jgi:hypothetical protein
MPIQNAQSVSATTTQFAFGEKSKSNLGIVVSVILDETHHKIKDGDPNNSNVSMIGAIEFMYSDNQAMDLKSLPLAYPYDKNIKSFPTRNETVEIIKEGVGVYYKRIGNDLNPNTGTDEKTISSILSKKQENVDKLKNFKNVENTGIVRSTGDDINVANYNGYGDYFKIQNIHKLKLYEGDTLIESRFGQSIRFSGYNNKDHKFSPTTIIRNGESPTTKNKPVDRLTSVEEDVNRDNSVIVLSSGEYQLPFLPGTVDDKNKSDFQTKPDSFDNYPSKLIGDQILINSGRIILSAKNAEMMFYSKKNYGFISDGALSIDNKLGIDISVGDDINIITNDRDVQFVTNNGSIFLGSTGLEPLVKGQQLVQILSDLIDAITQQMYLTPAGPTATGPTNIADFGKIKSKLNNILSKLNQTS